MQEFSTLETSGRRSPTKAPSVSGSHSPPEQLSWLTLTTHTILGGGAENMDLEKLRDKQPFEIIDNPDLGQQYRLLERGSDTDGEFLRFELRYRKGSKHFPEHVHPRYDETAAVLSGGILVRTPEEERTIGPGEQYSIPAGTPHIHRTASGEDTRAFIEERPPGHWVPYMRMVCGLAAEGKTDGEGVPNPLAGALLQDTYPDVAYSADLPIAVQKMLFKLLAPIGRLRGYTAEYAAVPGPTSEQDHPE